MHRDFIATLLAAKRMECEALAMLLPDEILKASKLAGRCAKAAVLAVGQELLKETSDTPPKKDQRVKKVKIG